MEARRAETIELIVPWEQIDWLGLRQPVPRSGGATTIEIALHLFARVALEGR